MANFQIENKREFDEIIVALRSGNPTLEECITAANALERSAHILINWKAALDRVDKITAAAAPEKPLWAGSSLLKKKIP